MSLPVRWWCGSCDETLHLENTLWRSPDGDYRCRVGGYPTSGGGVTIYVERTMHRPKSSWVYPALLEDEANAEQAAS